MPRVLSHDAYTIAWICALPLEMAAAKLILDEIHDNLPQPASDHNCYTLGSIHGHNIAIACLPSGVYGTTSAATVMAQMLSTFRSIKFGLMVGIGGGVPTKTDVQLGDVVVGIPSASSGGVIQFDFGKTLHSGRFQRIGSLNKPPQVLLTAVTQLRSAQLIGEEESRLMETISAALKGRCERPGDAKAQGRSHSLSRDEAIRKQFFRPTDDRLFDSSYAHQNPDADCSTCDLDKLVPRDARQSTAPRIHYGSIASGNQVMKDAQTRDAIAHELDVLCFEMEAAGLLDQLPCLVIRGICDYCDSHKSKEWQGYAALMAAAYTRTLLRVVPVYRNERQAGSGHWMAPFSRNASFVGRENPIATLEDEVLGSGSMRKIAICGLGGIGKTQIALELAYRVRDRDPEMSVFWIQCTSYESVEQAYMNLAQLIGLAHVNAAAVKEQVKAYLSHESSGKWLLVYDNADDMEMWMEGTAAGPPLKRLLPQNEAGHIVFTSRNSKLAVKLVSSNVIRIPDMDEETALRMLRKLLIRKDLLEDRVAIATLLEQLCYLPLAISQAAAYINENDIATLEDYLCLLAAQEEDVVSVLTEDFEDDGRYTDIQNPVATTWLVSFSQIQSSDPLAVEYLSFMACINPRNIPQSLLLSRVSDKKETEALGILKAYSFVSEEPKTKDLSLHRLVYLATRTWMKKDGTFSMWTHRTIERIDARCAVAGYDERDSWRRYLPHILSLIENKEVGSVRFEYGSLLQNVGYWLRSDGRYGEAKALSSQVLEDRQKYLGMNHRDTLVALHDLGSVLRELGEYSEAQHILEQALDRQTEVLGDEHPDTLMTLRALGVVLSRQGHCALAESYQEQALEGSIEVLGPWHLRTLECATGYASALFGRGNYELAYDFYQAVVDAYVRELGPLHEQTLYAVINTGMALWRLCQLDLAEQLFREVFKKAKETYGPEHPLTMKSRENLGYIYVEQERFGEADELLERALYASTRVLGTEHPDTLVIIDQRGIALRKQGRHDEAKALHRQAIDASTRHLGEDSPLTVLFLGNLAVTHWEQGQLEDAEELQLRVWESNKQQLGVDHPTTLRSMQNLAFTWESLGRRCDAIDLTMECLELRTQILGPEHDDTVDSRTILSRWQGIDSCAVVAEPATASDCDGQVNFEIDEDDKSVSIPVDNNTIRAAATGEICNTFHIQMPTGA
ncbi:hypothetical protein BJX65DRAFT_307124 [Aspergillus insuetus]